MYDSVQFFKGLIPFSDFATFNTFNSLSNKTKFLYAKPKTGIEKIIRFNLGTEPGIACYTQRHFNFISALLWPHQIPGFCDPNRFSVFVGGRDAILDGGRVRQYLLNEGMRDAFPNKLNSRERKTQKESGAGGQGSEKKIEHGGGLVVDWKAGHGQTFMPDNPYFQVLKNWVEGEGYKF
ncbi:hypothetical protein CROQUDRAFT_111692 [Cronartium quercuum f. sp. fusiforme G11]|uniref:Uncharacterized protein n=1 Tax=Cronartium quercuum f. sp. fusiforme G11 TaxID=708437 RepID=A0A9P6N8L9_9BASI|nr:hypothetical protein CROQUDRAFT_111692 [Cronartium quercuum f. sp. fusiforme G11]